MMREEILRDMRLRREYSKSGLALIVLYFLLNGCVIGVAWLDALAKQISQPNMDFQVLLSQALMSNAWGYILALLIAVLLVMLWKKKEFCFETIWRSNRPMTGRDFGLLLCIFLGGQAFFQITAIVMEWLAGFFGTSVLGAVESATSTPDTFSMFLYAGLFAPLGEELLFRGVALHALKPHGKKFAILGSAFLFGIYHGNIVQSPYAFAIGLVLGYVTVEYNIGWAMLLHMINNLVLGDMLGRLSQFVPEAILMGLQFVIIWGCGVATVVILSLRRKDIRQYWKNGKIRPWCVRSFIRSPGIIAATVLMVLNMLMGLL